MTHPLIDRLTKELGYPEINLANHDEFVTSAGMQVIFFPGDSKTVRDATDVAVILPELIQAFAGQLTAGVVTDTFGDGMQLKRQYGFLEYPALVFVRDGDYVGTIVHVQDWADYLNQISDLFVAPAKRAPGFKIPVVAA